MVWGRSLRYSRAWWGSHGGGIVRWLVTRYPRSGEQRDNSVQLALPFPFLQALSSISWWCQLIGWVGLPTSAHHKLPDQPVCPWTIPGLFRLTLSINHHHFLGSHASVWSHKSGSRCSDLRPALPSLGYGTDVSTMTSPDCKEAEFWNTCPEFSVRRWSVVSSQIVRV